MESNKLMRIEGTFESVKGQDFVEFYKNLGVPRDLLDKIVGTHWTLKVWRESSNSWGTNITCLELPHLNIMEIFVEGEEKIVHHPLWGGKTVLNLNSSRDGFMTISESENFGKITWEDRFTKDGMNTTVSCKGKSMKESWKRHLKIDGTYIFMEGENVENFMRATGYGETDLTNYKVHLCHEGDNIKVVEWYPVAGKIVNHVRLNVESPVWYPSDVRGNLSTPSRRVTVTIKSDDTCVSVVKGPQGVLEEWIMTVTDSGLKMIGTDKKSGLSCKMTMKRIEDVSGSYQLVSLVEMERFAKYFGFSRQMVDEMVNDMTTMMEVDERSTGFMRMHLVSKLFSVDMNFKLNEEFSFYHPILRQWVKAIASRKGHSLVMVISSSVGTIVAKSHFNKSFLIESVCIPAANIGYKAIFERKTVSPMV